MSKDKKAKKEKRVPIYYTKEEWIKQRGIWAYEIALINERLEGYLMIPPEDRDESLRSAINRASKELKGIREEREWCIVDNPQYYI